MKSINRLPNNFFITKGSGCDPYEKHAGSYHMALWDAGISDYNIMTYSSVLPKTANLISLDEIDLPTFGSELYTIMSCAHGFYGESISAGIIFSWMYEDEDFTKKHGGLVCEVSGYYRVEELEEKLNTVLNNLYERTYKTKGLFIGEPTVVTESHTVTERFGTSLVSLCFVDYL
jgi:arginine decarboxylase